jgi:hypothetical protein
MRQTKSIPTLVLDLPDDAAALQIAKKIAQGTGRRIVVTNSAGERVGSAEPAPDKGNEPIDRPKILN